MKKVILTKGLPASGKSTWAKKFIDERVVGHGEQWKRVNKDELRAMLDNGRWSKHNEKFILALRDHIILEALELGSSVIVDDTNLHEKHEINIRTLVKGKNVKVEIKDFTDVAPKVCIERDLARENSVGEKVIMSMYKSFLKPKTETPKVEYDEKLPDAIICDLDGTLALMGNRNPYDASTCEQDEVNQPIYDLLDRFIYTNDPYSKKLILLTGRDGKYRPQTEAWLEKNHIGYDHLYTRKADDKRKDSIVKKELYEQNVKGKYNILFVLDDRNQVVEMWRELGLTCLQVAEGDF